MSSSITLAFLKIQGGTAFFQGFIDKITGKYRHVEIIFTEKEGNFYACSINKITPVYYTKRTFGAPGWEYVRISGLSTEDVAKMDNFCFTESKKSCIFDEAGMFRSASPLPRAARKRSWFCSELVGAALQEGGLLKDLNPSAMTPEAIYNNIYKTVPPCNITKITTPLFSSEFVREKNISIL